MLCKEVLDQARTAGYQAVAAHYSESGVLAVMTTDDAALKEAHGWAQPLMQLSDDEHELVMRSCWILLEFDQFLLVSAKMPREVYRGIKEAGAHSTLLGLLKRQIMLASAEVARNSGIRKQVIMVGDFQVALAKADIAQGRGK